jgi:hypothetical protein
MRYFVLLLLACARQVAYVREPRPCQADAVVLVWHEVYGRNDRAPDIWWIPERALDCQEAGHEKGVSSSVGCIGGNSWSGGANLIWYGSWPRTNLAHELAHVAQARDGLPPDYAHISADFLPDGRVAVANARLAAANLCPPALQ